MNARILGHGIAVIVGLAAIVAGIAAIAASLPGAMSVTLLIIGSVMLATTYGSLTGSRASWSLLVSILAVFAIVTLFGAPTIRKQIGIPLGLALLLPLVQTIAVVALAMVRADYRED